MGETAVMAIDRDDLRPGTRVEVRSSLDGRWSRGFEVLTIDDDTCTLRRLSDGSVLPAAFSLDTVRHERPKNNMWWFG